MLLSNFYDIDHNSHEIDIKQCFACQDNSLSEYINIFTIIFIINSNMIRLKYSKYHIQ